MVDNRKEMTVNDFAMIVNLIDVCTKRGSFEGNELMTVGTLREKLVEFVKANSSTEEKKEVKFTDEEVTE